MSQNFPIKVSAGIWTRVGVGVGELFSFHNHVMSWVLDLSVYLIIHNVSIPSEYVVCEDEVKHALLASNCVCPGISTFFTLLLHTLHEQ